MEGPSLLVVEVLRELDKDYMALRNRLVTLIEQQPSFPLSPSLSPVPALQSFELSEETEGVEEAEEIEAEDPLSQPPASVQTRVKYWPKRQLLRS